ncbi:DUF2000 domain-containing protein [Culicoidibacter larvae]|uniref:DUF2000 domain-containing protein n=1 Tax=Culicoidibacter larvae TaxID=2579976 RepID=A0A5R8Q9W3_9FIRM|nr:DUF2000 domain-containing protein [Culicoidibacter larvae]TLG72690.1 DUF2000 domain-containing protein [Culicoidibacter larvae]
MSYNYKDKKIVAVLASNLESGIACNVIGHLALAIGANINREFMGENPLFDKSGTQHLGIAKYPFITTKVRQNKLRKVIDAARENGSILIADYPKEMLVTGHDDELVEVLSNVEESDLEYLGVILCGTSEAINAITGRFQLWG